MVRALQQDDPELDGRGARVDQPGWRLLGFPGAVSPSCSPRGGGEAHAPPRRDKASGSGWGSPSAPSTTRWPAGCSALSRRRRRSWWS